MQTLKNRNVIQHTCVLTKTHIDFFYLSPSLSFSPVTTDAGDGDRRAGPRARTGHGSGGGGGGGGSVICPPIEKNCDL